jgi:BRCT domain type II-containing protein
LGKSHIAESGTKKSKPNFYKFKTKRETNPMNPVYHLPKTKTDPPTPPKFIRDNITNDDIDGAKPKKMKYYETRDTMKVDDIEGSKPKPAPKRSASYSSFDYSDVTKPHFVSKRCTNPLNPTYDIKNGPKLFEFQ